MQTRFGVLEASRRQLRALSRFLFPTFMASLSRLPSTTHVSPSHPHLSTLPKSRILVPSTSPPLPPCFLASLHHHAPFSGIRLRLSAFPNQPSLNFRSPRASAHAAVVEAQSLKLQTGTWSWKNGNVAVKIYFEDHTGAGVEPLQNILLLPAVSDVSTTEEWRAVAQNLLNRDGGARWRIIIVDWPGFGLSERPPIDYTADFLEAFLADLVNAPDSPLAASEPPVIVGGGHAASIAVRALNKDLIKVRAIAAVAPTWAGPMPIVFGRGPEMQTRYNLLRGSLRAPGLGWMMYNFLVSNPQNMQKQYVSHVYADPDNVSSSLLESRLALTKREGARYAPAAFLTGLLDPVQTREEFLSLFADLEGKVPVLVLSANKGPKRSKAEMEALKGAKGVSKFVEIPGALLPQDEYPDIVSDELQTFLTDLV